MQQEYSLVIATVFCIDTTDQACVICQKAAPSALCYSMFYKDRRLLGGLEYVCFPCLRRMPEFADFSTVDVTPAMVKCLELWFKMILSNCCRPRHVLGHIQERAKKTKLVKNLGKIDKSCYNCGKPNSHYRCSGCQFYWFCSEECSEQSWQWHKQACDLFYDETPFANVLLI